MKIQTLTITIILLFLTIVSATEIYSGQSYIIPTEQFEYFEVVGNSSNIDGMEINWENGNTTISFDIAYKSDNFTIVLFNIEKEVITEVVIEHHYESGGGGGTRTKYVDRNITKYIDREVIKEVEVKGDKIVETETIVEEKIIEKIPLWMIITLPILLIVLMILVFQLVRIK